MRPGVVACCCLLVLAGCSGVPGDEAVSATDTLTPAPTLSPTAAPGSPVPAPVARVDIVAEAAPSVRVIAVDRLANRTVVNETFSGEFSVVYGEGRVFEPRRTYEVSLRVGDRVVWAATVQETEQYGLVVGEDGTVTVRAYTVT